MEIIQEIKNNIQDALRLLKNENLEFIEEVKECLKEALCNIEELKDII